MSHWWVQFLITAACSGAVVLVVRRQLLIREGYGIADEWDRMADDLVRHGASEGDVQHLRANAVEYRQETRRFVRRTGWRGLWERVLQREGRAGR